MTDHSRAITHLEAELGTTLFIRHKKGVAPTASAEQFHAVARRTPQRTCSGNRPRATR